MTADPRRVFSQRALWRGSSAAIFPLAGGIRSSLFPHLSSPAPFSIHSQPAGSRFSASIASFACIKSLCSPAIALPFKSRSSIPFIVAPASSRFSTAPVSEAAYGTRQAHSAAPSLTLRGRGLRSLAASGLRNSILPNSSPGNFFGRRTFCRGWHRFAIPGRVFSNGRATLGSMGKDMPAPIAGDPEREDPDAAVFNDRANAAADEVGAANSAGNSAASAATEDVTADKGAETAKAGTDESRPQNELWFRVSDSVKLVLQRGDITKWFVDGKRDAIVNTANPRMLGGGGVDGAIHRKAGPELRLACKKVPQVERNVRCPTGEARVTKGFDLPASRVIHTVGPVYHGCDAPADLLGNAYRSTLKLALKERIAYVAFPAISCGIYGYPFDEAAKVAISTISEASEGLAEVHFVFFEQETHDAWSVEASRRFSKL